MSNQSVQQLVNKLILSLETQPRTWVRIQNSLAQLERDLRKSAGQDPWSEDLDLYLLEQYRLALDLAEKEAAANMALQKTVTPEMIRYRELEIEMNKAQRWKGEYPATVVGGDMGSKMIMDMRSK